MSNRLNAGNDPDPSIAKRSPMLFGDKVIREKPEKTKTHPSTAKSDFQSNQNFYRPKTRESKAKYMQVLSILYKHLSDKSDGYIKELLYEILIQVNKADSLEETIRREILKLIAIGPDDLVRLITHCRDLKDFEDSKQVPSSISDEIVNINLEEKVDKRDVREMNNQMDIEEQQTEYDPKPSVDKGGVPDSEAVLLERLLEEDNLDRIKFPRVTKEINETLTLGSDQEIQNSLMQLSSDISFGTLHKIFLHRETLKWSRILSECRSDPISLERSLKHLAEVMGSSHPLQNLHKTFASELQVTPACRSSSDLGDYFTSESIGASNKSIVTLKPNVYSLLTFDRDRTTLPIGASRKVGPGYEEILLPATVNSFNNLPQLSVSDIRPEWQETLRGIRSLNPMQTTVFEFLTQRNDNGLICAPTGAGKTIVAVLAILREVFRHQSSEGVLDLRNSKVVYLAPMKALAVEVVGGLQSRLEYLGISVREFTGDLHLSPEELARTNVIVSTPEKWDVLSRKSAERSVLDSVRLIIVDEIHLLGDSRGPVLESIVWRALQTSGLRLIGLSATLPNSREVAEFMHVDPDSGLFIFGPEFRPVPLTLSLIGLTEKSQLKQSQKVRELLFEFVSQRLSQHQMIIFTHSRKEAQKTGEELREQLFAADLLELCTPGETKGLLEVVAKGVRCRPLAELLCHGIGFHHAGLCRSDRLIVEDLFASKRLGVLVSTATLAWGVNLPAHTVIVKGTQVYSPTLGRWTTLSMRDLLQMLGRAGRPGYDRDGEGIVLTTSGELRDIVRYLNNQQPLESKLMSRLPEFLNAEIASGRLSSFNECVFAIKESFLGVRIKYSPSTYGLDSPITSPDFLKRYSEYIINLTYTSLLELEKYSVVEWDRVTGRVRSMPVGRVVSYYYLSLDNLKIFSGMLQTMEGNSEEIIDDFRVFGSAVEFKDMVVREEELSEMNGLLSQCPVPVKSANNDPKTKAIVLLQCFISRVTLDGYVLASDLGYISQNAPRLLKALFDLASLYRYKSAPRFLLLSQMVERQLWSTLSPLRQLGGLLTSKIIRRLEQQEHLSWSLVKKMNVSQLKMLVDTEVNAQSLKEAILLIPNVALDAKALTITRTLLRIQLFITPHFQWSPSIHGHSMQYSLFVYDSDNQALLLARQMVVSVSDVDKELRVSFEVNLSNENTSFVFVKLINEEWIGTEEIVCIDLQDHQRPLPFPQYHVLNSEEHSSQSSEIAEELSFKSLLPVQSTVLESLTSNWESVFIGAPPDSGKMTVALLTARRMLESTSGNKVVILFSDHRSMAHKRNSIERILGRNTENFFVTSGDVPRDYTGFTSSRVILTTFDDFERLTRNYRKRTQLKLVSLIIVSDLSAIRMNNSSGELLLSRLRLVFSFLELKVRFIVLSRPVANFDSVCDWLEVPPCNAFNFDLILMSSLEPVSVTGIDATSDSAYYSIVSRRVSASLRSEVKDIRCTLVILSDVYYLESFLGSLVQHLSTRNISLCSSEERRELLEESGRMSGPGNQVYLKEGCFCMLSEFGVSDNERALELLRQKRLKLLVTSEDLVLSGVVDVSLFNDFILVKGPSTSEQVTDYFVNLRQEGGTKSMYCRSWETEEVESGLRGVVVLESGLLASFLDVLNTELVAGTLTSLEDCVDFLTWTLLYRRLRSNPSYYQLLKRDKGALSEFISEMVESAVNDLVDLKCIFIGEGELAPTNSSIVAAFYGLKVFSVAALGQIARDDLTLQELLETVCSLEELRDIRLEDRDVLLHEYNERVPLKQSLRKSLHSNPKAVLLLQSYLLRLPTTETYLGDTKMIVNFTLQTLAPLIDLCFSQFLLRPILLALKLAQMITQQIWIRDSPLKQLPYFDGGLVAKAERSGLVTLDDFFELEDEGRGALFKGMDSSIVGRIAWFANRFPNVQKNASLSNTSLTFGLGDKIPITISMTSEFDYSEYQYHICTNSLLLDHLEERWWVLVVDKSKQLLLMVKKLPFNGKCEKTYTFTVETEGSFDLSVLFVCESYMGFDSEVKLGVIQITNSEKS